jgi:hypothetical protein
LVYLPPAFTETREDALIEHIERHDFAMLVTRGAEAPIVSQIPLLLERRDGRLFLQGHLARPNPQVADFDGEAEALAMFAGPHAYISPSWYETGRPSRPGTMPASTPMDRRGASTIPNGCARWFGVSRSATRRASPRRGGWRICQSHTCRRC